MVERGRGRRERRRSTGTVDEAIEPTRRARRGVRGTVGVATQRIRSRERGDRDHAGGAGEIAGEDRSGEERGWVLELERAVESTGVARELEALESRAARRVDAREHGERGSGFRGRAKHARWELRERGRERFIKRVGRGNPKDLGRRGLGRRSYEEATRRPSHRLRRGAAESCGEIRQGAERLRGRTQGEEG